MTQNQLLHRIKRIPELDGLRGLAVLGVLFFHLGFLPGGYLGVDLFFVLSGYLITSLLLHEYQTQGHINLKEFWLRRARRLLPALLLFLAVIGGITVKYADPSDFLRWRNDTLTTLAYVVNWRYIFAEHDYWALFSSPSPLAHMWSLAIEEQFYIIWPLFITLGLSKFKWSIKRLTTLALVCAFLSAVWLITIYSSDNEATSRAYFGTDTRIAAILFGAAVSLYIFNCNKNNTNILVLAPFLRWVLVIVLSFCWLFLEGQYPLLYQGGLLICSVAAALIILAVSQNQSPWLQKFLRLPPLMWIGTISYGLYLWHFPIYVVVDVNYPDLNEFISTCMKLALTFLCAVISFFLLEMPIRTKKWPTRLTVLLLLLSLVCISTACIYATLHSVTQPTNGLYSSYQFKNTTNKDELRTLVVGDSMAVMLGEALSESFNLDGYEVIGVSGCGVLGDVKIKSPKGNVFSNTQCNEIDSLWNKSLVSFEPDAVILMYGGPVGADRFIDGIWTRPCNLDFDNRYEQKLVKAVSLLGHSGATIFLSTIAYPTIGDSSTAEIHKEMDCINEIFRNVSAAHERVEIIELASFICPSNYCHKELNSTQLRIDGLHYSEEGGRFILQWLDNQVRLTTLNNKDSK